jgi:streptogramin lyase
MRSRTQLLLPFVGSFLICASFSAQTITEFPLHADSQPGKIVAGQDGNLWYTEFGRATGGPGIGRITTSGNFVDFPIEDGSVSFPVDLAAGPDGNLWFTQTDIDLGYSAINRITPAGALTRFPVPSGGSVGIAGGPDGNVWFTVFGNGSIGRITPGGEFRFFSIPTAWSGPTGITAGRDGNLWFTETAANKIGRITPAGVITEFEIPTPSSGPRDITAGSDGNLWFTEYGSKIGRITPEGVVTEFPVSTRWVDDIAAGPDGNLWFIQLEARIGRITTSGVVTEIPIPRPAAGITAGPDGNIWFTERGVGGRVGRLTLTSSPAIDLRILPVVGSTLGVGGSFFKTAVQLHNSTSAPIAGRIVFHPSGLSGSRSDLALSFTLSPDQTQSIADLLPAMDRSGLGSADIEVTSGSIPSATVRLFNEAGAAGTTGFTEELTSADEALRPGQSAVLLFPADLTRFRFNLGLRTLESGAAATLTLRDASGAVVATVTRAFPATYHEQQSAAAFLGVATLPAGGSISVALTSGSAIFYAATVDNTTGDPSLQIARVAP